jgi:hypothetical protein
MLLLAGYQCSDQLADLLLRDGSPRRDPRDASPRPDGRKCEAGPSALAFPSRLGLFAELPQFGFKPIVDLLDSQHAPEKLLMSRM